MNAKLKLKKPYQVVLENSVCMIQGSIRFEQVVYSKTHLIPGQTQVPLGSVVMVPVSQAILGFRKASWMLLYRVSRVDHETRTVTATLSGLKTMNPWRSTSRVGPHDWIYDPQTNTELLYYYSPVKPRIPRSVKIKIRKETLQFIREYTGQSHDKHKMIVGFLTGQFTNNLQKRIVQLNPQWSNHLRGPLIHRYQDH